MKEKKLSWLVRNDNDKLVNYVPEFFKLNWKWSFFFQRNAQIQELQQKIVDADQGKYLKYFFMILHV